MMDFILLALIYFVFFYRRWSKGPKKNMAIKTIMYVYIALVSFVTLMPFTFPFGATNHLFMQSANFVPFRDLLSNYHGATREIVLNIIMMMPFGFLYPLLSKRGILATGMVTFLFSLIIECSQLLQVWWGSIYPRAFDVTDLITNTCGGLLGFLIFFVARPVVQKIVRV
ncbi:VanZ family protein [Brevibacillus sp. TJ4]|uniref:VanZ family protein n=1 Tax=Brevibacillus sp. TJ4 TaxID=3234853 RepID=UPI003B9F5C14